MTDNLHIVMILDESDSMNNIRDDIINSVNEFIKEQRDLKNDSAVLSLIKFNNKINKIYCRASLKNICDFSKDNYNPNNNTALYDAIGKTITEFSNENNICVIIITDGEENFSSDFSRHQILSMIEDKKKVGWNFIYLSADLSLIEQGENIGITRSNNGEVSLTQNMVRHYKELPCGIIENCSSLVSQIRTVGHMVYNNTLDQNIAD